jgi:hypothetical protein
MLLWVFFRAQSFGDSMTILSGMFGLHGGPSLQSVQVAALVVPLALVAVDGAIGRSQAGAEPRQVPTLAYGALLGVVVAAVLFGAAIGNKPFIYFRF